MSLDQQTLPCSKAGSGWSCCMFRNGRGLGTDESHIPVMIFDLLLCRSHCLADEDFATFTGNPVDHAVLFSWINSVLWSTKCDLRIVAGLKTA